MNRIKNLNLKVKLIWGGLAAVLLSMLLVGGISTRIASKALVESSMSQVRVVSDDLAVVTGILMEEQVQFAKEVANMSLIKGAVNQMAKMKLEMSLGTLKVVDGNLARILVQHEEYESLAITDAQGNVISDSLKGVMREKQISLADRDYFSACKQGKATIGIPVISRFSGEIVVVAAVPIKTRQGTFGGILAAARRFSALDKHILSKKVGATGRVALVNSDGTVLAHPNPDYPLKIKVTKIPGMAALGKKMLADKFGVGEYTSNGKSKICGYGFIPVTGWTILITQEEEEFMAGVRAMTRYNLIVGALVLLVMSLGLYFSSITIIRPINRAVGGLKDISEGDGDLTKRLAVSGRDEVGVLATAFNTFIEKLHEMVSDITRGVDTLSNSSAQLSLISDTMTQGVDQTSQKAGTVGAAAEEMATNMNSVSAAMEQSSANMNAVATAADQMNSTISDIAQNAERARTISQSAVVKVCESTDRVNQLSQAAQSIGKVVETISDISEQVNLLSLNATIEAARAGEAGKGFAVVANEIKALASQTSEASLDIKEKIDNIQGSSKETMGGINEIAAVIQDVDQIVDTIAQAVGEQSSATQEIAENISQASSGVEEVNQNISQSSLVVGDITREIAGVNQSAEQMTHQSAKVHQSSKDLTQLAEGLGEMMSRFKI